MFPHSTNGNVLSKQQPKLFCILRSEKQSGNINFDLRYYQSDGDIQGDWELQGFVNEVSADGTQHSGAKVTEDVILII